MKIAVIGAGVVGVTTAYELAADGHAVTVFERRSAAAEETSFANAGVIAPACVTPWSAPGAPLQLLSDLFRRHAATHLGTHLTIRELAWMWEWFRSCRADSWIANCRCMRQLALYSRHRLDSLSEQLSLEFDASQGYLILFRSEKERQKAQEELPRLRELGTRVTEVTVEEAQGIEPALNVETPFVGGIHLPDDGVANCRQFALLIKQRAQRLGVQFEFNTEIGPLSRVDPMRLQIKQASATNAHAQTFDHVVVCGGTGASDILQPMALSLPLATVYGYSISATVTEPLNAPRSAIFDERFQASVSRLGNRVRVAGMFELGVRPNSKSSKSLATLYKVLQDWFPGAARLSSGRAGSGLGSGIQEWKAGRSMTPDGPPLLGQSGVPGLWLNIGHGTSGWALSCGCARVIADQICNKQPEVDIVGLGRLRAR